MSAQPCAAWVRNGAWGPIAPRPCARLAPLGERFCRTHQHQRLRPFVSVTDGGWCVWCGEPARRYNCSKDERTSLSLCLLCARALVHAIREVRP
jgi:hypothetical protein